MIRNFIKLLLLIIAFTVTGQEAIAQKANKTAKGTEISFSEGKWAEIVALAKKSNKYIFVDGYAVWCGPCKLLKAKTFKEPQAATYFNKNFINFAINLEVGEGIKLAEEWGVNGYPALIFFSPEGKLILKQEGYVDGAGLIEIGKYAQSLQSSL